MTPVSYWVYAFTHITCHSFCLGNPPPPPPLTSHFFISHSILLYTTVSHYFPWKHSETLHSVLAKHIQPDNFGWFNLFHDDVFIALIVWYRMDHFKSYSLMNCERFLHGIIFVLCLYITLNKILKTWNIILWCPLMWSLPSHFGYG